MAVAQPHRGGDRSPNQHLVWKTILIVKLTNTSGEEFVYVLQGRADAQGSLLASCKPIPVLLLLLHRPSPHSSVQQGSCNAFLVEITVWTTAPSPVCGCYFPPRITIVSLQGIVLPLFPATLLFLVYIYLYMFKYRILNALEVCAT